MLLGIVLQDIMGSPKMLPIATRRKYEHWDMETMGWKYNMDDIQAALLIQQIDRLNDYRQRRQNLETLYRELLMDIDGLDFMEAPQKRGNQWSSSFYRSLATRSSER